MQCACRRWWLCGAEDLVTPVADHEAIAARIAGARFEKIADCGHLSTIEQPAAVSRLLAGWLARYSTALTMSSTTFLASPNTIIVLSM